MGEVDAHEVGAPSEPSTWSNLDAAIRSVELGETYALPSTVWLADEMLNELIHTDVFWFMQLIHAN